MKYQIGIIGGGPAGYVAAIKASKLGAKTVLFEKEHLGGVCLNYGCIPTKAILESALVYKKIKNASALGLDVKNSSFELEKIINRAKNISNRLKTGINFLLKKAGVTLINHKAELKEKRVIFSKDEEFECENIIIATGSRAKILPDINVDEENIITYKGALNPKTIPNDMIIIGSGAIGMEFAEFYASFGSKITVIEAAERIMPNEEKEVSETMRRILSKRGYTFITGNGVKEIKIKKEKQVVVKLNNNEEWAAERVLLAVGIVGNIENIGLEKVGIETFKGHIKTNEFFETSVPHIYAVGDVANPPYLAHKASHEGIKCVELIMGRKISPVNPDLIPFCTYTSPQIASFGIKEGKSGKFPLMANGKALTLGESEGFIKSYLNNQGKIIGASMIGENVTELIASYLALANENFEEIIFPHPTLSESIIESVLSADNNAIHI